MKDDKYRQLLFYFADVCENCDKYIDEKNCLYPEEKKKNQPCDYFCEYNKTVRSQ